MDNPEIIEFAVSFISSITNDLNESLYSQPTANLNVIWKRDDSFNARAIPKSRITEPPVHIIELTYGLVIQLYHDIDEYCSYIENKSDQKTFDILFKGHSGDTSILPCHLEPEDYRKNMYIGALTWVYFHELAHLNQEHVYILNKFIDTKHHSMYEEFNVNKSEPLKDKEAAIHHVLELAADFEAIQSCLRELIRHFKGDELTKSIGLFVSSISCAIYKLHNPTELSLSSDIKGSHPPSIVRLEQILPQIWESLDLYEKANIIDTKLNRKDLVHICDRSATSACFFWFRKKQITTEKMRDFIFVGTINRRGGKLYLQTIINTWDVIKPEIVKNSRMLDELNTLNFTETLRDLVLEC